MVGRTEFYDHLGQLIETYNQPINLRRGGTPNFVVLEVKNEGKAEWHTYAITAFTQIITLTGEIVYQYFVVFSHIEPKDYFL